MARIKAIACSATARSFDALRAGERGCRPHASASREYWSVPALIDWMKASRRRRGDQLVAPQAGDHSTSDLADARLEIVERAHLEPVDAGVAQCEAFAHAIGDMGEAEGQLVSGGERTRVH